MTLTDRYKRESLRMLLLRHLKHETDEDAALERLDEIWLHMNEEEHADVDAWVRKLPESLRANGPPVQEKWERASGLVKCATCSLTYYEHPIDPRDGLLHVSCDGRRWKL